MTAIRGYVAPTTESDALGVHSLDQFVLAVPDASVAQDFYGTFGLDVQAHGNTLAIKTFGHHHRWGSVVEGAKTKALHHLSFGCYAEDLPRLKARIEGNGVKLIDPPPGFESNGFWFRNHENVLIEIKVGPKVSPDQKSESQWTSAPAGTAGAAIRANWPPVRPRRLSHVLDLYPRRRRLNGILLAQSGPKAVRPRRRPGRLYARHPRQRSSSAGAGEILRARLPPLLMGRRQLERYRTWRDAHGRQRLDQGLGARPPRARLQLFPLCARSVGQLLGIFLRHRLHPQGRPLAGRRPQAGGTRSISGDRKCRASSPSITKAARASHSTTIFTLLARLHTVLGAEAVERAEAVELVIGDRHAVCQPLDRVVRADA